MKYSFIFLISALFILSCHRQQDETTVSQSDIMFEKTVALYKSYLDSLNNPKDSLDISVLMDNFESRLVKISFDLNADTHLQLTEEQNDSIIKLHNQLMASLNRSIKPYMSSLDTDSIINESESGGTPDKEKGSEKKDKKKSSSKDSDKKKSGSKDKESDKKKKSEKKDKDSKKKQNESKERETEKAPDNN